MAKFSQKIVKESRASPSEGGAEVKNRKDRPFATELTSQVKPIASLAACISAPPSARSA